jgi:hypothetical protein
VEFSVTIKNLRYARGQVVWVSLDTERTSPDDIP